MTGLEARLTADPASYRPVPNHGYRTTLDGRDALIALRRPPVDDRSRSFAVTFEPAN